MKKNTRCLIYAHQIFIIDENEINYYRSTIFRRMAVTSSFIRHIREQNN